MNRRVLFVDDDEAMLERVEHSFRDRFDVCLAKSGEDGLDQLRTGAEPAVVVSDLYMPRMNGLEFIREARAVQFS